jgi:hypothetical protein
MPRFHIGQKVLITGPMATKDRGREATVVSIQPNTHIAPGANKYIVRFEEGDEADFYEIQLLKATEKKAKNA